MTLTAVPLSSPAVRLRPTRIGDAEQLARVLADPALYRFIGGGPPDRRELRSRLARQLRGGSPDRHETWLNWVVLRDGGRRIVGTMQATVCDRPDGCRVAELAWMIGCADQGRGLAKAAAALVADWLIDQGITSLRVHIDPEHRASQAVAASLGLRPTDQLIDGEARWVSGPSCTVRDRDSSAWDARQAGGGVMGSPGRPIVPPVDASVIPRFSGIRTFARLPTLEQVGRADVAVLGAPFDGGTTFRAGTRYGPSALREASLLLRPYNEPLNLSPFAECQIVDAGDAPANPVDIVAAHNAIEQAANELHRSGARVLGLGGDHSVSLPFLRAAAATHGPLSLLQFDAHTDTWDTYFGSKLTHGTMFRRAVEQGIVDGASSVQIGLRGSLYSGDDITDNASLGFTTLLAREFDTVGVSGAIELAVAHLRSPVYVTVDIDCLDPAFAPGTGTPEAGGLTSRELLAMLRGLAGRITVVAADVVEVSPPYDPSGATAVAGSNAAYDLLSLLALGRPDPV